MTHADMPAPFQLFPMLDPATEAALRASIDRFGVLVPVHRDQHGRTLDGHHRARIADELGVPYQVNIVIVADDDEAAAIARTLNTDRRHLTVEQRRDMVKALLEEVDASGVGVHSPNAVADALGVSEAQVRKDAGQLRTSTKFNEPAYRRGQDGKIRPAKRPTQVHAKNEREAKRAQDALDQLGAAIPSVPVLDVKRTERIAREKVADERRSQPVAPAVDSSIRIEHCGIEDLTIQSSSVSLILTDPPYPAEYLALWSVLAERAAAWLAPNGALLAYSGQWHLPEVIRRLSEHLDYWWLCSVAHPGEHQQVHGRQVRCGSKPALLFRPKGCTSQLEGWVDDLAVSDTRDKALHDWQQDVAPFRMWVQQLSKPGGLVVDPFVGSGTTAVACRDVGRRFIGCDIDAGHVRTARERLA
jgi:ParB-like chromosome segregation protein Spo0J